MNYFWALVFPVLLLVGCSEPAPDPAVAEAGRQAEVVRLNEFFARSWEERLADSPELRSRLGQRIDYDKWDDISPVGQQRRQQRVRDQLAELTKFDFFKLDAASRLSFELFEEEANRRIDQYRWRQHHYLLDQQNGIQADVPAFLIGIHQVRDEADALAYIARLRGIQPLFLQVEERLAGSEALGVIPPRFVFPLVASDIRNVLAGRPFDRSRDENVLLKDFREKVGALDLPEDREQQLVDAASAALLEAVGPAYRSLAAKWSELEKKATTDDGVWKHPNGIPYYRAMLRWYTTTDLGPDEIHELGLQEVARVQDELRALMPRLDFEGTLPQLFVHMRERRDLFYPETDAGREAYLEETSSRIEAMRARLETAFGPLPQEPLVVQRVEAFRERSAGKAFYQRAADDGSRPATYYVNLYRMSEMPKYELEALAYHEGIPGHHLQRTLTRNLGGLPEFRKRFPATAFTEGWGLYAERLAKELGGYDTPIGEYGRLSQELARAVRLVVDTGIHAKQWSREQAIQYHLDNTPLSRAAATKAVERYIVYPAQATAYMVGLLRIVALREEATARLGADFDVRAFHSAVLGAGPVSLNALPRIVNTWIEGQVRPPEN